MQFHLQISVYEYAQIVNSLIVLINQVSHFYLFQSTFPYLVSLSETILCLASCHKLLYQTTQLV